MSESKAVYVILSSTNCNIGRIIRSITRYEYNHVSIALTPDLDRLYSFARYRKNAPFYAGFVQESGKRYVQGGKPANIKMFEIPVSDEKYQEIAGRLEEMSDNKREYIYNLISAMCVPLRRRVKARNSFTCIEFSVAMLANYCDSLEIDGNRFWSIRALQDRLADYLVYEGPYMQKEKTEDWGDDVFLENVNFFIDIKDTVALNGRLFWRLVQRRMHREAN